MAVNKNRTLWHFLVRQAGLLGLVALVVGLVLWFSLGQEMAGQWTAWIGLTMIVIALLFELQGMYAMASSRRGAVGFNVAIQVALAVVLLVGINVFSFEVHRRFDWTRDRDFTIDAKVRAKLANLRGDTDIIVFQRHLSFGQASDKQDNYDAAAERKIVEKVKDLAEQFQELGPRFKVQVLDSQDEDFESKLDAIGKTSPELADAIKKAPENSIFFRSQDKIQRLAFHDVYQLDRSASKQANEGRGNLVLNYQGIDPFVNKIMNIEQSRPRVALGVIASVLAFADDRANEFTMNGAKQVLESYGFNTLDILLRKRTGDPSSFTFDENQHEVREALREFLEREVAELKQQIKTLDEEIAVWRSASLDELNRKYVYVAIDGRFRLVKRDVYERVKKSVPNVQTSHVDADDKKRELGNYETARGNAQEDLDRDSEKLEQNLQKLRSLQIENLEEQQRIKDVRAKMNRLLADCELLILPRITMMDLSDGWTYSYDLHKLDQAQLDAVKDFMKAGKPVLFCLGPNSEPPVKGRPPSDPDNIDEMLIDLGFRLPRQTVLHIAEASVFTQRRDTLDAPSDATFEPPPVIFDWKPGTGLPGKQARPRDPKVHPIRTSLELLSRSVGQNKDNNVRLRYLRPVYYMKKRFEPEDVAGIVGLLAAGPLGPIPRLKEQTMSRPDEDAAFMMSNRDTWNEEDPFPSPRRIPKYKQPEPDDPKTGSLLETRKGPLPVASAVEVEIPKEWFPERSQAAWAATLVGMASSPLLPAGPSYVKPRETTEKSRIAVIGSGNVFVGKKLTPVQQKLLLDLGNWLLGREDLLARDRETWQYPRVHFTDESFLLWQWATRLGLPLAFVFVGMNVWLVRRMR